MEMTEKARQLVHVLRNPYTLTEPQQRAAMQQAAEEIERAWDAYVNMRDFAQAKGLDTAATNRPPEVTHA